MSTKTPIQAISYVKPVGKFGVQVSITTPPTPSRRLVVRTADGQDGIIPDIRTETTFPSQLRTASGTMACLVRVTDRYVLYQELANPDLN